MLAFLTDEHISPTVADQVRALQSQIVIHCLQTWREGTLLRAQDDTILSAAREDGLTLVTYDQRTIAPMLVQWAIEGRDHSGVVFIDEKSIAQEDVGRKVIALISLWDATGALDWTNAVSFLKPEQ